MLDRVKSFFALLSGWLAALALALFWASSRRRPAKTIKIEPKAVPTSDEEMLKAARDEGIIN